MSFLDIRKSLKCLRDPRHEQSLVLALLLPLLHPLSLQIRSWDSSVNSKGERKYTRGSQVAAASSTEELSPLNHNANALEEHM